MSTHSSRAVSRRASSRDGHHDRGSTYEQGRQRCEDRSRRDDSTDFSRSRSPRYGRMQDNLHGQHRSRSRSRTYRAHRSDERRRSRSRDRSPRHHESSYRDGHTRERSRGYGRDLRSHESRHRRRSPQGSQYYDFRDRPEQQALRSRTTRARTTLAEFKMMNAKQKQGIPSHIRRELQAAVNHQKDSLIENQQKQIDELKRMVQHSGRPVLGELDPNAVAISRQNLLQPSHLPAQQANVLLQIRVEGVGSLSSANIVSLSTPSHDETMPIDAPASALQQHTQDMNPASDSLGPCAAYIGRRV